MELLTREAFAEHTGSAFQIYFEDDEPTEAELVEVTELKTRPRQETFSLFFRTANGSVNPQPIYKITHPQIGAFELFLVPASQSDKGVDYEAVINRLTE